MLVLKDHLKLWALCGVGIMVIGVAHESGLVSLLGVGCAIVCLVLLQAIEEDEDE